MYGGLVKESVSDIDTSDSETVGELPVGMYSGVMAKNPN